MAGIFFDGPVYSRSSWFHCRRALEKSINSQNPSNAIGSRPTALITEVRPPNPIMHREARQPSHFSCACRSSSLPSPSHGYGMSGEVQSAPGAISGIFRFPPFPLRVSWCATRFLKNDDYQRFLPRASFNFPPHSIENHPDRYYQRKECVHLGRRCSQGRRRQIAGRAPSRRCR